MDPFAVGIGSVLLAIAAIVLWAGTRLARRRRLAGWQKIALALAVIIGLLLVDAYVVEPNWIQVERVTIRNARLAEVLEGTRVVQISDLHIPAEPGRLEESLVSTVNRLNPDLVVITGDFVSDVDGKAAAVAVSGRLEAKLGKFGVPGNNDNYCYKPGEMRKLFPAAGVVILVNEHRRIPLPNGRILNLAGVNDPVTGQARIDQALAGIPAGEPVIMLAHTPAFLAVAAGRGIDLLLTGHTHGGQSGLARLARYFNLADPLAARHDLYRERQTIMYVNRGIATTTVPFRFLCRPEVTVFEFVN